MRHRFTLAVCIFAAVANSAGAQMSDPVLRERERLFAQFAQELAANPRQAGLNTLGWITEREAVPRLLSIITGNPPGGKNSGWVVPSRTRYNWSWLQERFDRAGQGVVAAADFTGPSEWFNILDRDRDGRISAVDLDWSENSPLSKANINAKSLFRATDGDGDGRLSPEEWQALMTKLSQGRPFLVQDDLLALFAAPPKLKGKGPGRGDGTINMALFEAFFNGDVASILEGPRPGTRAPDFALPTVDGKGTIKLSDSFGKRPTVLVFGSFT